MMNGTNVCMASLSQFLQLYTLSNIQDTVHLLETYHYSSYRIINIRVQS